MKINELQKISQLGIKVPTFDIVKMQEKTKTSPQWLHFGAGNIFRGFIANIANNLLDQGELQTGIIAVDSFDFDIIDKIYAPFDNLSILVKLFASGKVTNEIVAGVATAYKAKTNSEDYAEIEKIFKNPSLQMVSFTITEKGYQIKNPTGEYFEIVLNDIKNSLANSTHIMTMLVSLLKLRFENGAYPIAICSMDNCSHNGDKLKNTVLEIANLLKDQNKVSAEFIGYLSDENMVSFPLSMIDKITPRPSKEVENSLTRLGFEDISPIVTSKNTYIAPFVNAEVCEYLVIEDKFPNGRPALEKAGVYMTDCATVNLVETMKVTTCLNPLHTALAVYGCLLGYTKISDEMKNPLLLKLIEKIGYEEGMKVVANPKIIDPKRFIDEVINERLKNPFIPDSPQRIATDTSLKVGIRFGETIKAYHNSSTLDAAQLTYIPLAIAGFLRYMLGIDDKLEKFELSPDSQSDYFFDMLKNVKIDSKHSGEIKELLQNEKIFGIDLVRCGLSEKISTMFNELIKGENAVINTLAKYTNH